MRRILSLTPEQRDEVKRKVVPPAKGERPESGPEDKPKRKGKPKNADKKEGGE